MVLKRVNINEDLNYKIDHISRELHMSHNELIQEAVLQYVENYGKPKQEDDVYTLRINQLTEEVSKLSHEVAGGYQSIKNKLDTISVFGADTNYLTDDIKP